MEKTVHTVRIGTRKVEVFATKREAEAAGYGYYYTDDAETVKKDVFIKYPNPDSYSAKVAVVYRK